MYTEIHIRSNYVIVQTSAWCLFSKEFWFFMWLIVKFQGVNMATTFMTKTSLQIIKKIYEK
jgi:hypothetical protein